MYLGEIGLSAIHATLPDQRTTASDDTDVEEITVWFQDRVWYLAEPSLELCGFLHVYTPNTKWKESEELCNADRCLAQFYWLFFSGA